MVLACYVRFSRLHYLRFLKREPKLTGILQVTRRTLSPGQGPSSISAATSRKERMRGPVCKLTGIGIHSMVSNHYICATAIDARHRPLIASLIGQVLFCADQFIASSIGSPRGEGTFGGPSTSSVLRTLSLPLAISISEYRVYATAIQIRRVPRQNSISGRLTGKGCAALAVERKQAEANAEDLHAVTVAHRQC